MPEGELEQLRQRKRELLLESDINRQILRVEFCQLKLKADEWKRGLLKARTAYNWFAPLAGIGLAAFTMRKKMHAPAAGPKHNGHASGKVTLFNLIAPIGAAAARQALNFWKHARKRNSAA